MANYDLGIFVGHGTSEKTGKYDPGACANGYKEYELAKEIAADLREHLKASGLNVHFDENNYNDNDTAGNTYRLKFVFSFHLNAGGGSGAEAIVPLNESYFNLEQKILNYLASIGLQNRGVKSRNYDTEAWSQRTTGIKLSGKDYYGEIRNAWNNGVSLSIIELGFIDNKKDLDIIIKNKKEISENIAKLICEYDNRTFKSSNSTATTPKEPEGEIYYRVIAGSYKDINNAKNVQKTLAAKGFASFIEAYKKK